MHTEVVKSVGKSQPAVQARELQNIKETINQSMDCYQHLRMEFDAMKK
jgi:hypothetical protein